MDARELADSMPQRPSSPRADVSADLEDIFRATPIPPPLSADPQATLLAAAAPGRRERRLATWGGLAAAGLAVVAAGLALTQRASPPASALHQVQIALVAAPGPSTSAAQPSTAAPLPEAAWADPQVVRAHAARARPARDAARAVPVSSRCEGLGRGARARCGYPAVLAADRRLRAAYGHAVRAGVSRPVLVRYRNRWASLRHDAAYRPGATVAAYGAMADDLRRLASRS